MLLKRFLLTLTIAFVACATCFAQGDLEAAFKSPSRWPELLPNMESHYALLGGGAALDFGDLKSAVQWGFAGPERGGWAIAGLGAPRAAVAEAAALGDQPYWPHRAAFDQYVARLATMSARGRRVADVAAPVPLEGATYAAEVYEGWLRFYRDLALRQVGLGLTNWGAAKVQDNRLVVEGGQFRAVVLPPSADVTPEAVSKLAEFVKAGGMVVAFQKLPEVEGIADLFGVEPGAQVKEEVRSKGTAYFVPRDIGRVVQLLRSVADDFFSYPPSEEVIFSHRREQNADWYLLANLDVWPFVTYATFRATGMPEIWDADTGQRRPANGCQPQEGKTIVPLNVPPGGTIFVVFRKPVEDWQIRRAPGLEVTEIVHQGNQVTVKGSARLNSGYHVWLHDGRTAAVQVTDLPDVLRLDGAWRFQTDKLFQRQPAQIVTAKAKAAGTEEDTSQWARADLDDSGWTVTDITQPLPAAESAWHASWLGFEGDNVRRYFRKAFAVPGDVARASITIACDNAYDLYLNGEKLGNGSSWEQADTYTITDRLKPGQNVIAVDAWNEGGVAGLLTEAYILLKNGQSLRVVTDASWRMSETAPQGWPGVGFDDSGWKAAQVIGQPPVAPWGNVAGLPPEVETGKVLWYRFPLPPGATILRLPDVQGADVQLYLAGKRVALDKGEANVAKLSGPVALRLVGRAALPAPIVAECGPGAISIGSWASQGYAGFVGVGTYRRTIQLPAAYSGRGLMLDLGQVGCAAEVTVNGKKVGARLWPPYEFDLGTATGKGLSLTITVANTLAAAKAEGAPPAGILGPVQLKPYKQIELML